MTDLLPAVEGEVPEEAVAATYQDVTPRGDRKPLVAEQWQRHNMRATVRHLAGLHWHKTRYHAYRSHIYAGRTAWYTVRGAFRLLSGLHHWVHWREGYEIMSVATAAGRTAHGDATRAHTEIEKTRARRGRVVFIYAVPVIAGLLLMVKFAPWWAWLLLATVLVRVLAHHGRPQGKRVLDTAVVESRYEKLTGDIIVRALSSLGISAIDRHFREGNRIDFPPAQRDGPGWRITFDLPFGVTASEVIDRRDKLAAGLRRPAGCVWPEPESGDHPGRLTLYVSDEPLAKMKQPAWPLAKAGQADIFQPVPFGTDQRGKPQSVTLIWANMLIGAISRMGKTVAMRNLLLAGALDPRVEEHIWELKGTGDLSALEKIAHSYGSGADDETIEATLDDLRKVHGELERRAKKIKELPREVVPDSKVTPQLASRRSLRLHPLIFAIDECQEAFSHPDYKAEFEKLCLALIRRGPALAIILVLATQRPDSKSLPTAIRANIALRFCLKVMDQDSNDMILGTAAYKRGINSTLLAFSDKGVGWALGFADAAMILKAYNINGPAAERICVRARALREEAGTLSGYAAGDAEAVEQPRDVLGDVLKVFEGNSMQWEMLADRLAVQLPERWASATAEAVSAQCRSLGVPTVQVKVAGVNRQGCRRLDVQAAHDA